MTSPRRRPSDFPNLRNPLLAHTFVAEALVRAEQLDTEAGRRDEYGNAMHGADAGVMTSRARLIRDLCTEIATEAGS